MNLPKIAAKAQALGHPSRLELLRRLAVSPAHADELCEVLGGVALTTMRYHLDMLLEIGLVRASSSSPKLYFLVPLAVTDFTSEIRSLIQ